MTIFVPKGSPEEKNEQMLRLKMIMEQRRRDLIQRLTTLDSTILGVVVVFHDRASTLPFPRYLIAAGTFLVLLSLLAEVHYIHTTLKEDETVHRLLCKEYPEEKPEGYGAADLPLSARTSGAVCPICFCLGVLSFAISVFLW